MHDERVGSIRNLHDERVGLQLRSWEEMVAAVKPEASPEDVQGPQCPGDAPWTAVKTMLSDFQDDAPFHLESRSANSGHVDGSYSGCMKWW